MKRNLGNNGNGANKFVSRLAAEKKKTVCALCLIGLMVFMWVRVLSKRTPQGAEAALIVRQPPAGQLNSELKVAFIELPEIKGRNDVLTRDFFAANGWRGFLGDGRGLTNVGESGVVSGDSGKEVGKRVAEKLKLEAIMSGENPQAFINDVLLSVGDKLPLRDRDNTYECEVVGIEADRVFIRCGQTEIQLKLAETLEADRW
jgi:hypothetical protein